MKLKKITEACMWLPGFAPEDDTQLFTAEPTLQSPIQLESLSPKPTIASSTHHGVQSHWPRLEKSHHLALSGDVEKFEANIRAINLLRKLEEEGRDPAHEERIHLNLFTGWGGLTRAFNDQQSDSAWAKRSRELRTLLSAKEYEAASQSTLNAHFTPVEVIEAMWSAVQRLGFQGGRIIEPAAGVGYFLGAMPQAIASNSTVTAVEIDDLSARITRKLYEPHGVRVLHAGFESANTPEGFYDLAISNVPFDKSGVPELRNVPYAKFSIHNYFFAKALEVVRPGGLVAFITSSYTLDAYGDQVREYLSSKGDLVAAIRLPSDTFKAIANTSVTTDIVILQKRGANVPRVNETIKWTATGMISPNSPIFCGSHAEVSSYFLHMPEHVIGKITERHAQYGKVNHCVFEGDLCQALQERVNSLPQGLYQSPKLTPESGRVTGKAEPIQLLSQHRQGLAIINGQICEVTGAQATPYKANAKVLERITGLIKIRDAVRKLLAAQNRDCDDANLTTYRTALSVSYDSYVSKHGHLGNKLNRQAFKDDPDLALLLSLELWDEENKTVSKAAIFTRKTTGAMKRVEHCSEAREALHICLAEAASVNPRRIADLVRRDVGEVMQELESSGDVYLDPDSGHWIQADAYLSGNVRKKLAQARVSGDRFARNVSALEQVLPEDLKPSEITARVGSTWIPAGLYAVFLDELLTCKSHTVEFNALTGTWYLSAPYSTSFSVASTQTWGTKRVNAARLFDLALNQQEPTVYDQIEDKKVANTQETIAAREKQFLLKEKFVEWLWSDVERASQLARIYNDQFNSIVTRRFDGSHLTLGGMSSLYTLRPHQKDAVWRIISSEFNTLLAHAVGAGKTLEMICAAMELKRVGKATKVMLTVPNHMLYQIASEFMRAYPSANILLASKDDLQGDRRKLMTSRIATGDWDAVVVTHSTFERLALSDATMQEFIQGEMDRIETKLRERAGDSKSNRIVRQLARAKKIWRAKLQRLSATQKKDGVLDFEDLGIDWLMVDEAHLFKSLYKFTKMDRIAGLPNNNSERAFDLFAKTRQLMGKRGDNLGVTFATATPIANSIGELFTMQQFLQPQTLEGVMMESFDAWAGNFGESVTALELAPDGRGYRMNTRFAKFVNVPELMRLFWQIADIRTLEMLNLPVPVANVETITAKPSEAVKAYVQSLVERAERIRSGGVTPNEDNMLAITGDGRKAALDMRLVDAFAEDYEGNKLNLCAHKVHEWWVKSAPTRGAQIVFCDLSVPRTDGSFSAYNDLRDKLIAMGIPAAEIAFIHDHDTDVSKDALFESVRAGTVRVLMGSTQKMGVGTNVQTRLVALHALDAPWRPCDVEQRDGRIVRQGNTNSEVWLYRYITEATFDAYVWQLLEAKARFIAQVMCGNTAIRTMEDVALAALSFAQVKALASGNPLVLEKAGVDAELTKLAILRNAWEREQWSNKMEVLNAPQTIANKKARIESITRDIGITAPYSGSDFVVNLNGNRFDTKAEAGRTLATILHAIPRNSGAQKIGSYKGLDLFAERSVTGHMDLWLKGDGSYSLVALDPSGIIYSMVSTVDGFSLDREHAAQSIARMQSRLDDLKRDACAKFEKQDRIDWLVSRQKEIEAALDLSKSDLTAVDETPEKVEVEMV